MNYTSVLVDVANNIATVTINRPKALNALNAQTFTELDHIFGENLPKVQDLKGVIVTGAGEKAFVAGADISEFGGLDQSTAKALSTRGQQIFDRIERFHVPVVAAINGFALGGGLELALACHLRIASVNAKMGLPEVNLGIIPGYGGTQRLPRYIGKTKAMELALTADMIKADQALALGLINRVAEPENLVAVCHSMLAKISTKGPLAVAGVITAINAYYEEGRDGYDVESSLFGKIANSEDFKEGAAAFMEKRKANFKGQ